MTTSALRAVWRPQVLAAAVLGCSTQAGALTFDLGEIEGHFDSSLSIGASWSMRSADPDLINTTNGGKGLASTGDDGRLNFKKGETFSKIFKGVHDLELKYGDSGVFLRGKYWYDFELKDEGRQFKPISDRGRKEGAKSSGAELLDAFLYHNYRLGDLPGSVRLGKQVVSWGESTFIGNSINSINPLDAAAFRRPGAEIKEGLIPVNMFYLSQSLTENLSAEAFYQLEWDQSVADNCGTFFAVDMVADGCLSNLTTLSGAIAPLQPMAAAFGQGFGVTPEGVILPRAGDRDARDSGQFGLALRWLGDGAEYGVYAMNYHSRSPFVSYQVAGADTFGALGNPLLGTTPGGGILGVAADRLCGPFGGIGPACLGNAAIGGALTGLASAVAIGNGRYLIDYPEDIRLYGLSFSTSLPTGTSWAGELSYRPNAPIQISTVDLTRSLLNPIAPGASPVQSAAGAQVRGYERKEVIQAQTSLTHFVEQVLGAERLTLVAELGIARVGGLEHERVQRYGRDSLFGAYGTNGDVHGFVTRTSWGYRSRAVLDYSNLIAGINVKPNLSWSHDVDGYGPNGLFNEGAKAISLGLDADYQNTYTASLSYTDFFGGQYNALVDRDFLALSFGMNF